jgi:serine protease DegQ
VEAKSFQVPYRLTVPKHILVRAKINGKGPFNFILDTGAPALFVATKVADKLGVKKDNKGWGSFDRFEIEGGVVVANARGRIEDPFQLEGMNGLGLAGAELHGVIGYNILARYRMEIDFTSDKMVWTPLKWTPDAPKGLDGGKSSGGSLEMVGTLMKMMGSFIGAKATPDTVLRGFFGIQLLEKDDVITVQGILDKGPAAGSGLQTGDRLTKFQGRTVINIEDVHRLAKKLGKGEMVKLTVQRGDDTKEISFKTGEGL